MTCDDFVVALSTASRPSMALAEHAGSCARCARLWEADMLLRSAQPVTVEPIASVPLQRLFDAGRQAPEGLHRATPGTQPRRRMLAVLLASAACNAVAFSCMPRADLSAIATALLVLPFATFALFLLAGLQLYVHRGRTGLGPAPWLRWAFALAGIALVQGVSVVEAASYARFYAELGTAHGVASRDCLYLGLGVAGIVGTVAFVAARRTVLIGAASAGALAGSIAGLCAAIFLHFHCAGGAARHLSIAHGLPLVCAVVIGALAGRRVLAA